MTQLLFTDHPLEDTAEINAYKIRNRLQIMVKLTIWLVEDYITKKLIG